MDSRPSRCLATVGRVAAVGPVTFGRRAAGFRGREKSIRRPCGRDRRRLDTTKEKEALFAYLWVDVVYNHDPAETAKAQDRVAELFKKMGNEEREKTYRDKARGRP